MAVSKWKIARYLLPVLIAICLFFIVKDYKPYEFNIIDKQVSNEFYLINSVEDIPTIDIDYTDDYTVIREQINQFFSEDLCNRCAQVAFKVPFEFNSKKGFLKVMTDYDTPICDCPIPSRVRYYLYITVSDTNMIFVDEEITQMDHLSYYVYEYLQNVGKPEFPERYNQVNFRIDWSQQLLDDKSIQKTLNEVTSGYLRFITEKQGNLWELTPKELDALKKKYPLRIELDLGKRIIQYEMIEEKFK